MLSTSTTIEELSVETGQEITLVVQLTTPANGEASANQSSIKAVPSSHADPNGVTVSTSVYRMPDVFIVMMKAGKEVLVKLERSQVEKPFIGGYKHKVSGVEFHHASTQTLPKRKEDNGVRKLMDVCVEMSSLLMVEFLCV